MITFNLIGDLFLPDTIHEDVIPKSLQKRFKYTDFNLANLEAPLDQSGKVVSHKCAIASDSKNISILKNNHINVVSLANNHTLDYGYSSFSKTQEKVFTPTPKFITDVWEAELLTISPWPSIKTQAPTSLFKGSDPDNKTSVSQVSISSPA